MDQGAGYRIRQIILGAAHVIDYIAGSTRARSKRENWFTSLELSSKSASPFMISGRQSR